MPFIERVSAVRESHPAWRDRRRGTPPSATPELRAVAAFAVAVDALGELRNAPTLTRLAVLGALQSLAPAIDLSACEASPDRYGRRVLADRPAWSLAAITLRDGQETEPHDHGGWGGVVTVRGIERDRRYRAEAGELVLVAERDYLPGTGYVFDPADIHQPVGADPRGVTVALHFLVLGDGTACQTHHEVRARVE
jgi:predicted metal-dependent enzyme (double-stranded beta helix superfamily)